MTNSEEMTKEQREEAVKEFGFSYSAEFIPQSQSRNAGEKEPSLNWRVKLVRNGAEISEDYMQGIGHLPLYQNIRGLKTSVAADTEYRYAAEKGQCARHFGDFPRRKLEAPSLLDVLYSLIMDADAIDYTFAEWCSEYGYDEDSRKAESIYKKCVEVGIKLRRMVGDGGLTKLRDIFNGY